MSEGAPSESPLLQLLVNTKLSPTIPVPLPPVRIPVDLIAPLLGSTKRFPTFTGSSFGTIHGFTQRGFTETTLLPEITPEFEGLNTSAVAVARTVLVARDQIRENKVGMLARVTCTVTSGLTPNRSSPGTAGQYAP